MPRFYFDLKVEEELVVKDEQGEEMPDIAAATRKAAEIAAAIGCDEFPVAGGNGVVVIEVRDDRDKHMLTITGTMSVRVGRADRE